MPIENCEAEVQLNTKLKEEFFTQLNLSGIYSIDQFIKEIIQYLQKLGIDKKLLAVFQPLWDILKSLNSVKNKKTSFLIKVGEAVLAIELKENYDYLLTKVLEME